MPGTLVAAWVWFCLVLFVVGCVWKAWRYATAPVHLRWDLYPVAHEPRRAHGGSYLEEKDWWAQPRKKDLLGEVSAMAAEILLLEGVRENNRRLWWGSFPFHWGLYLLVLTTLGLALGGAGIRGGGLDRVLTATGLAGGGLTALGAAVLLALRSTDRRLRPYTSILDRVNLLVLLAFGVLSALVAGWFPGMPEVARGLPNVLAFRGGPSHPVWGMQMAAGALFLLYLPLTRMVHFFAKYFTYHEVRWDDEPLEENRKLAARVRAALDFGVDWSAAHVRTGRTWAEVATSLPDADEGGE